MPDQGVFTAGKSKSNNCNWIRRESAAPEGGTFVATSQAASGPLLGAPLLGELLERVFALNDVSASVVDNCPVTAQA